MTEQNETAIAIPELQASPEEMATAAAQALGLGDSEHLPAILEEIGDLYEVNEYDGQERLDIKWIRLIQKTTDIDGLIIPEECKPGDMCVPMRIMYQSKDGGQRMMARILFMYTTYNNYPDLGSNERIQRIPEEYYREFVPARDKQRIQGQRPIWGSAYSFVLLDEESGELFRLEFAKSGAKTGRQIMRGFKNVRPNLWARRVSVKTRKMEGNGNTWFVPAMSQEALPPDEELETRCAILAKLVADSHAQYVEGLLDAARKGLAEVVQGPVAAAAAPAASFSAGDDEEDM